MKIVCRGNLSIRQKAKKLNENCDNDLTNKIKKIINESREITKDESKTAAQQLGNFDKKVYSKIELVENIVNSPSIQGKNSINEELNSWKRNRVGRINAPENNRLNTFELSKKLEERFKKDEKPESP